MSTPVRYCDHCHYPIPQPWERTYHCPTCHMTVDSGHTGYVAVENGNELAPRTVQPCPTCIQRNTTAARGYVA